MCNGYNHSPGCTCGWGGEGHAGRNYLGGSGHSAPTRSSWPADDFCRPTTCPICGCPDVFFIRYNGGSIYVDSLGPPWPIHSPCFDKDDKSSKPLRHFATASQRLYQPRLGIITAARRHPVLGDLHLDLAWGAGKTARLRCRLAGPADGFWGNLVLVCAHPPTLHHPTLGTLPVQWTDGDIPPAPVVAAPPAMPKAAPKTTPKRPLNSLNWTDEQLAEQEAKIIATIKSALEATRDPAQSQKIGKRLALTAIRKLPRPLRNLLLHRFEKNRWRQLPPGPPSRPPIPEWRRRFMERARRLERAMR